MDPIIQDLKYALRRLTHQPGFTCAAVLTLALGIGANAALFSLLNAVLLRPSPGVIDADRLVNVYTSDYSGPPYGGSSYPDFVDFSSAAVFNGAAAYTLRPAALGNPDAPDRVLVEITTPDYFAVLGVPVRGRVYSEQESSTGAPVAVVSEAFWRTHLGASESAMGRTILINARPLTVIGIAGEGYRGAQRGLATDVWVSLRTAADNGLGYGDIDNRGGRGLSVIARLRPGVSIDAAEARLLTVAQQLHRTYPDQWSDINNAPRRISLQSERAARVPPMMRSQVFGFAGVLAGMVALVLLICCANVAGLMMARVATRSREIAVRLSLGATRARIGRLLLCESALVSIGGALLGLLGAAWSIDLLLTVIPPSLPVPIELDVPIDFRVIAFTVAAATIAALMFGAAPALHATRADLTNVLKSSDVVTFGRRRFRMRSVLVASQVTASVMLLIMASLFLRSLRAAAGADLGYDAADLLIVDLDPKPGQNPDEQQSSNAAVAIAARVATLAGVASVSWADHAPLGMDAGSRMGTTVEGYERAEGEDMEFHFNLVGPRYFETLGVRMMRGREFTASDDRSAQPVVIINEAFARRFWPGQDPLGKRLSVTGPEGTFMTIVGVTGDAAFVNVTDARLPHMFIPALQQHWGTVLHIKAQGDPLALADAVRAAVVETAPDWLVRNPRSFEQHIAGSVLPQRIAGRVLSGFGVLAVLLAAVGLYGVVAFSVAQRTRELGIRLALGATRGGVVQLAIGSGMKIVLFGVVIGAILSLGTARLAAFLLLGTSPTDPVTFLGVPTLLLAVTFLAAYLPARRAANVDPMTALRSE